MEQSKLTDEQIDTCAAETLGYECVEALNLSDMRLFARAVERQLSAQTVQPDDEMRQAHRWATQLAYRIASKHYPEAPQFEALPYLVGVISQIDHMTAGLTRAKAEHAVLSEEQRASLSLVVANVSDATPCPSWELIGPDGGIIKLSLSQVRALAADPAPQSQDHLQAR